MEDTGASVLEEEKTKPALYIAVTRPVCTNVIHPTMDERVGLVG